MTQALNLANFANNLNTSGATSNAGLQNSSVTVTAGTGMSGGGAVSLGSSVTLTNAGVTSVAAGSGISVSASTGAVTISASGAGTVTSVATGNGLSGGTITTSGTLIIAAPSANSIGSWTIAAIQRNGSTGFTTNNGDTYAASSSPTGSITCYSGQGTNSMTGTWRVYTGNSVSSRYDPCSNTQYGANFVMCRIS